MTDITWVIPPSTLTWLDTVPSDRPVAMLVRHSVRGHLPPGDAGYALPIIDVGHQLARELGMKLRGRLRRVHASPLLRTMQTAERLASIADLNARQGSDRSARSTAKEPKRPRCRCSRREWPLWH